jgi:antitoxin (DNA-binding transcriptional repressor) of toxin-antitoxin stability system
VAVAGLRALVRQRGRFRDYLWCYGGHMREVGIKELKRDASAIVQAVEAGETVLVTRRGMPVARIGLLGAPARVQRLVDEGRMTWPGLPTELPCAAAPLASEGVPISQQVLEDRR